MPAEGSTECALESAELDGLGLIPGEAPDAWMPSSGLGFGSSPWLAGMQGFMEEGGGFVRKQGPREQPSSPVVQAGGMEVNCAAESSLPQEPGEAEGCALLLGRLLVSYGLGLPHQ